MIYDAVKKLGCAVVHRAMTDYAAALRTAEVYEDDPQSTVTKSIYDKALKTIQECEAFFDSEFPIILCGIPGDDLACVVMDNYNDPLFVEKLSGYTKQ